VCTELAVLLGNKESLTTPVTIDVMRIGKRNRARGIAILKLKETVSQDEDRLKCHRKVQMRTGF
jgi:hypothetical protein